jgi:hypothetical protein
VPPWLSARFAAPSLLSGAILITSARPPRAVRYAPNAFTMPTFSSVLPCFGSSVSECVNCSSALSGWFE